MTARETVSERHTADYLRLLRKHRWLITGILLVSVVTVGVWTFRQPPVYQAAATILIDPEPPKVLNIQEVTPIGAAAPWDPNYYSTQYEIIGSRPVLDKAAEALKRRLPALAERPLSLAGVIVEPRRNTRLVLIKVEDADPTLAAEKANAVAHAYQQYNLELKMKGSSEAFAWLTDEASRLRAKVQESAVALQNYRVKAGILGLEEQRKITAQKIIDFNKAYLEAQAQRLSIEARLQQLTQIAKDGAGGQTILNVADNPYITKLKGEASDLEIERSKLLKVYKDKHPEILKIDARIRQVQQRLDEEVQNMLRAVQTEYKVAKAREDTLFNNVNQMRREGQDLNEKEIQYLALQREAETNQQLYDSVVKRLKETGVTGGLETNNVSIVEAAVAPAAPIRPRKAWNLGLAVAVGLGLGLAIALAIEYFDTTIRTPDDVERHLGFAVIGIVAKFAPKFAGGTAAGKRSRRRVPLLITQSEPKSPASEGYRMLRTNIQFAGLDQPARTIVFTSAGPGEGKTTSVANFAVVCAEAGTRVCLIDSDLRRPMLHLLFGLDNSRGLTTALLEGVPAVALAQPTATPSLSVLTSGPLPPNPAELVGSMRMRELLESATSAFDLVLCDSPPVISVTDGTALAAQCEGVVLVVRAGAIAHEVIRRAADQIEAVKGRVLGVILNTVDLRRDGHYYRYYHYYRNYQAYYGQGRT
jgi:capsular exopolysaccharide synthesis family protein